MHFLVSYKVHNHEINSWHGDKMFNIVAIYIETCTTALLTNTTCSQGINQDKQNHKITTPKQKHS